MAGNISNLAWTIPSTASKVTDLTRLAKEIPTLSSHQVLVKLTAASLNYRDILVSTRSPLYPSTHKPDLVPGVDGAGTIYSVGASSKWIGKEGISIVVHPNSWLRGDVRNIKSDRIIGGASLDGTLQQYMAVDDECIIEAPKHLAPVENASLITAGTTAWAAIRGSLDEAFNGEVGAWKGSWTDKRLQGKSILILGTGGVSCFAIQIASALGATVIVTSSSDIKLDIAKSLGATHLINYLTTPDWDKEVLRLTNGNGVDHVIETGGCGTLLKSIISTRPGGLVSLIGVLTPMTAIDPEIVPALLFGGKIVKGCMGFSREATTEFVQFVQACGLKPVIARSFDFEHVVDALEALQKLNAVGKIVVQISED